MPASLQTGQVGSPWSVGKQIDSLVENICIVACTTPLALNTARGALFLTSIRLFVPLSVPASLACLLPECRHSYPSLLPCISGLGVVSFARILRGGFDSRILKCRLSSLLHIE